MTLRLAAWTTSVNLEAKIGQGTQLPECRLRGSLYVRLPGGAPNRCAGALGRPGEGRETARVAWQKLGRAERTDEVGSCDRAEV